ncbi:DUF4097 family beta strand repeat-containing protein [Kitasatospora purpeofusca]|uniref:DUF4097 family beta strand repeat-containing protein n=1 Tax=Kitasatospora purpeofusca TaxID=67352 RepID=UPI0036677F1F
MQKFHTPTPVSVVLDIPAGRFRLTATDRTDTTVEVLPLDASKSRDVKAAERTGITYADGVLLIEAPRPTRVLGSAGSVEVTVGLPVGSHVRATAADAELLGDGRLGDVAFEASNGTVELDETAGARLALLAGDITVGRLGGPGGISTEKGDIRITEAVHGVVTLRTVSGDLTVGAARGVSAALDAGTASGRIHNSLRNSDGAPALTIHATTAHGDITARSL